MIWSVNNQIKILVSISSSVRVYMEMLRDRLKKYINKSLKNVVMLILMLVIAARILVFSQVIKLAVQKSLEPNNVVIKILLNVVIVMVI